MKRLKQLHSKAFWQRLGWVALMYAFALSFAVLATIGDAILHGFATFQNVHSDAMEQIRNYWKETAS